MTRTRMNEMYDMRDYQIGEVPQLTRVVVPSLVAATPGVPVPFGSSRVRYVKATAWSDLTGGLSVPLISQVFGYLALFVLGLGLAVAVLSFGPQVMTRVKDLEQLALTQIWRRPSEGFGEALTGTDSQVEVYQPVFNPTLPAQNRLTIAAIGVETTIGENTLGNVEESLRAGTWRVPDFGTPFARKKPTILVAHRFGYLAWSNQYRRENSFFNLPKLSSGDRVEIIWNQRRYVYEIYGESEGADITDYRADLILYTCRFLDSDIRIFKYGKLIEI